MDADADRVTPYVFWQLSPDDDQYVDVLEVLTSNPPGQVRSGGSIVVRPSSRCDLRALQ